MSIRPRGLRAGRTGPRSFSGRSFLATRWRASARKGAPLRFASHVATQQCRRSCRRMSDFVFCHTKPMAPRGLEPRTFRLRTERSDQLSYDTSGRHLGSLQTLHYCMGGRAAKHACQLMIIGRYSLIYSTRRYSRSRSRYCSHSRRNKTMFIKGLR